MGNVFPCGGGGGGGEGTAAGGGTDPSPRGSADSNGAASTGTGISANNGLKATSSSAPAAPAAPAVPVMTHVVSGIPGSGGSRRPSLSNEVLNHVASSESKATPCTNHSTFLENFLSGRDAHNPLVLRHHFRLRSRAKLRALLCLPKQLRVYDAAKWACDRLGVDLCPGAAAPSSGASEASTAEDGLGAGATAVLAAAQRPDIVVVDARSNANLDAAASVARNVRSGENGDMVVIVAVVKKSFLERAEDLVAANLLSAGFNRILYDSESRGYWLNELAFILHHDIDNAIRLSCVDSLLSALDAVRDVVQISDEKEHMLYANVAAEKLLGFSREDEDAALWDEGGHATGDESGGICDSAAVIRAALSSGKAWEGKAICRRKTGDTVRLDTKIIPSVNWGGGRVGDSGGKGERGRHHVFVRQPPPLLCENALSTSELYDKVPPTMPPMTSAAAAAAAAGSSSAATDPEGGSSKGSASFDHGHPQPPHPAARGHHNSIPLASTSRKKSLKSFKNVTYDMPPMTSFGAEGSSNVMSSMSHRRPSGAKLHSLAVEAPMTKVINIILAAQENSPLYIAQALDKVLEILQSADATNLYSPEVEREKRKQTNAVTTDLLGALLANSTRDVLHQRRGSADHAPGMAMTGRPPPPMLSPASAVTVSSTATTMTATVQRQAPSIMDNSPRQIREALERSDDWADFDILELERLTDKRCLVWLGMTTMLRFEVPKVLKCSEATMQNWLTLLEANYNRNPYHNSTHAADVLHASACFLDRPRVKEYCDEIDEAACLVAAVVHDVNHPGRNSAFLCNSNSELAYLYNDITVLENHHAALAFKLTLSDDRVNIFKSLDRDSFKLIRQSVIDLVLATEMSKHFVHVNKFNGVFGRVISEDESVGDLRISPDDDSSSEVVNPDMVQLSEGPPNTPENVAILKRMLIKCADVSNPARPLKICKEWAFRIAEEYFAQTDDEKKLGYPVVMPQFDRTTCSIPKSQIGFYDFFIFDMFEMWSGFSDFPQVTDIIRTNYDYWKEQNDREEAEEANSASSADMKQVAAAAAASTASSTEDTLKEATEEEETTAERESSHRQLDDIPSIDDDDN